MEGWRSARQAFLPMAWSPCARPMDTVVFPSPEGVGVMADTRMSLAGVAVLSSTFKGILALLRPKGMTSFSSTPSLLTQSENAGMTMCSMMNGSMGLLQEVRGLWREESGPFFTAGGEGRRRPSNGRRGRRQSTGGIVSSCGMKGRSHGNRKRKRAPDNGGIIFEKWRQA